MSTCEWREFESLVALLLNHNAPSSHGGDYGERICSVKDASFARADEAGASRILDRDESSLPIMPAVR